MVALRLIVGLLVALWLRRGLCLKAIELLRCCVDAGVLGAEPSELPAVDFGK